VSYIRIFSWRAEINVVESISVIDLRTGHYETLRYVINQVQNIFYEKVIEIVGFKCYKGFIGCLLFLHF
jgi:hypothetical protein